MGLVANKLVPVDAVVKDSPSLDTARHNMEKIRRIEPGLSRHEGNEDFLYNLSPTTQFPNRYLPP
jgi:hypothetical protein